MRHPFVTLVAALGLSAAACSPAGQPAAPVQPAASSSAPAAAATPAPSGSTAPAASGLAIAGTASYFGAPLAGATVTAHRPDQAAAIATATVQADGSFTLALPAGVKAGAVLELVSVGQGHEVLTFALAGGGTPSAHRTLADVGAPVVLDVAQTAAAMALAPRLLAALQLDTDATRAAVIAAEQAVVAALGGQPDVAPAAFDALLAKVFDPSGHWLQPAGNGGAIGAALPTSAIAVILKQADVLADAIRTAVAGGKPMPDAALLGPITMGSKGAQSVFDAGSPAEGAVSSGSSGARDGVPTSGTAVVDLSATPADGVFSQPGTGIEGNAH